MYFFNINGIKKQFIEGKFTDKDLLPYLIISIVFYIVLTEINYYFPVNANIADYTMTLLSLIISITGILYAYHCNGRGEGKDFASKFFSIGFVVLIRFLVFSIPLFFLIIIFEGVRFHDQEEIPTTFFQVIILSIWEALYFYRTAKHIGDTKNV